MQVCLIPPAKQRIIALNVKKTASRHCVHTRAKGSTAEALVAAGGSEALYPPKWQSARYRALLARENGQWHIKSLTLLEALPN